MNAIPPSPDLILARAAFDMARQQMLRAWTALLRQRPLPDEVDNEMQATGSAMRQIVGVYNA